MQLSLVRLPIKVLAQSRIISHDTILYVLVLILFLLRSKNCKDCFWAIKALCLSADMLKSELKPLEVEQVVINYRPSFDRTLSLTGARRWRPWYPTLRLKKYEAASILIKAGFSPKIRLYARRTTVRRGIARIHIWH